LSIMDTLADHLDRLRRRLVATARHVNGARALMAAIYGVGPMTSLALCAWLGGPQRFSSSRKAVRFTGLDITVHSSDSKRSPGRLSRQGPEVLRWLLFEAAKTSARSCAPGYRYYTDVKARYDANRAALSQARRIVRLPCTSWPISATTRSPSSPNRLPRPWSPGEVTGSWRRDRYAVVAMGFTTSGQLQARTCQTASPPIHRRRGRPNETERPRPPRAGGQPIHHPVARPHAAPA
jgi:transposase IS116/IS110/IS902 family protein